MLERLLGYFKIAMATTYPRVTVLSVINIELHASVRKDRIRMICTYAFTLAVFVPVNKIMHKQPFSLMHLTFVLGQWPS